MITYLDDDAIAGSKLSNLDLFMPHNHKRTERTEKKGLLTV